MAAGVSSTHLAQRFKELIGVTPHMLRTLGLPIRRGRELTETESFAKTPYAVVNEAMAKKFWPGDDPIGHRFRTPNEWDGWFTIVGVVPDYRHGQLDGVRKAERPCPRLRARLGGALERDAQVEVRAGAVRRPEVGRAAFEAHLERLRERDRRANRRRLVLNAGLNPIVNPQDARRHARVAGCRDGGP